MENKKLYKSKSNCQISGVCGGIGEYFNIDPTVIRTLWVLGTIFTAFSGVLVYFIFMIIIPEQPNY